MDEANYLRLIRGETRGPLAHAARFGLGLVSSGYGWAINARNTGYNRGWLKIQRAPVPVVSVGNLTLGGTGKTPTVEWVARWYRARGVRVAILSRGYGRAEGMNDEGRVLGENLPDVPPFEDADRVRGARTAVEESESQLIVLDDGFQHRRLARDLDIVLLDALEPFGLGRLFPRGLLREPVRALRRAGVVVLSRADLVAGSDRAAIRAEAERHAGPLRWAEVRHAPRDLVDDVGSTSPVANLATRSVAAFCGIGNPEGFRRTLTPLCGRVLEFRTFPDHHPYSAADMADLTAWAGGLGADLALTTQKDSVKLRPRPSGQFRCAALRIDLEVLSGATILDEALSPLLPHP